MIKHAAIAAAVLAVFQGPVAAQGITGGDLDITYTSPIDGGDFGGTSYSGGLEYAITRDFSIAGDVATYSSGSLTSNASTITLHGIYHMNDSASLGVFVGRDSLRDDTANVYGLEAGTELNGGLVEGYIGVVDGASDATMFGVDGSYALRDGFSLTGSAGLTSIDGNQQNRIAVGGAYQMNSGPEFFGEIGTVTVSTGSVSANEAFIAVGARINFGAARGTTFSQRSIYEMLPNF